MPINASDRIPPDGIFTRFARPFATVPRVTWRWPRDHERLFLALLSAALILLPAGGAWALFAAAERRDQTPVHLRERTSFSGETFRHLAFLAGMLALGGTIGVIRARKRMVHARTTELRHDFLSTVSHELKTPLTSVRLLVDTLNAGQWANPERTRQYAEIMHREITRLSHLLDSFITYSRLEHGKMRFDFSETDPAQVAEHAVAIIGGRFRGHGCLDVAIMPDLPLIHADSDTLITALLNVLDNAYKFTPKDRKISLRVFEDGGRVNFCVSDNGIGLTPRDAKRVIRGFYRVDAEGTGGGAGLGISIVNNVVAAHRGEFDLRSEPGKGSSFTIRIPVHNPDTP